MQSFGRTIIRFTDAEKSVLRFGFVILRVEKVTIGVFKNNPATYHCYRAAGFRDVKQEKEIRCQVCGEMWNVLELAIRKAD